VLVFLYTEHLFGEGETVWCCSTYVYDSLGRIAKIINEKDCLSPDKEIAFHYNSSGNPDTVYTLGENGIVIDKSISGYDQSDSLISSLLIEYYDFQSFPPGDLPSFDEQKKSKNELYPILKDKPDTFFQNYSRNSKGQVIEDSNWSTFNYKKNIRKYYYKNDLLIEMKLRSQFGDSTIYDYSYDSSGRMIESICYYPYDPKFISDRTTYKYDTLGRLELVIMQPSPDIPDFCDPWVDHYCYDKNGRLSKVEDWYNFKINHKFLEEKFKYDKKGRIKECCCLRQIN
jgi:hypothetical protein